MPPSSSSGYGSDIGLPFTGVISTTTATEYERRMRRLRALMLKR
jgi:hypothetical protein